MKKINFKTVTLVFFLLLLAFKLSRLILCPCENGIAGYFYHHSWMFYGPLIALYLIFPVIFSFFPGSRFHTRNIICKVDLREKWISITFDDGPDPGNTPLILDILKNLHVPAAFFLIGHKIPGNEALVNRIFQEGHEIGNHSYCHSYLWDFWLPEKMRKDILRAEQLVELIIHRKMRFFRPPYGVVNPMVESAVSRTHYKMITWSKRSLDTCIKDEGKLLHRITDDLKPGDIILLHDRQININLLEKLIKTIRDQGFQFVSMEQLIKIPPYV
ncbi:MAG: polysaccharide deacetylase family protein [Bacteroidales bacterium]|jgi:peptidoglycan/xylan/chitin deacetylase (PgdA/CDA1 family)|nr:polysaccharide deacetylase family protein [Bacteroidales bacterium]